MTAYRDWLVPAPNPEPPLDSRRRAGAGGMTRDPAVALVSPYCSRPGVLSALPGAGARGARHRGHPSEARARGAARGAGVTGADEAALSAARRFAESTVRIVLEVLDRRRPVAQLVVLAEGTVIAAVRTLIDADLVPGRDLGTAVPIRVSVVLVNGKTAEVYARYGRGGRCFALAARIARTRAAGWRLTALRIR
ncbi:Rv3235 family protein [Nocardia sp. 004]|uniref:Rv3235 family protein n=1 Tax=Nocardia sp. 004 TaxID=3385978 RepID=UPI0039A1E82E